ncbi:MAG: FAD-dependent oxidoreductase [Deltaproteobacteria bacterium]|nr:FAD-dependent oxidoreductase [Deltaproteobacteria bacterium]
MNPIKSPMGRRQFLIAAGVTSTSALALNRLAGVVDPVFKTGAAAASELSGSADVKGTGIRYSHLLSPIKIGNVVLKNRMYYTKAQPTGLQGPETFPNEALINYYANAAKNGAAVVTITANRFDLTDRSVQAIVQQMTDAVHFYGSRVCAPLTQGAEPQGYNISETSRPDPSTRMRAEQYRLTGEAKEITVDMIDKMIEDFVTKAKLYQSLGFDMVNFYMSYRSSILANSLSPAMNRRTDKYGGSLENRARLTLELAQAIKKACGRDFLIEAQISGEEEAGGYTLEDAVNYSKIWEDSIDILQLRAVDGTAAHPTGYNSQKKNPITLRYAEAIKKGGAKIVTAPNGGFQDLDLNEEYIASGKTDMIAMARSFICDPEYGKKAYEGRGEDVTPCIRCNKCHGGPCSVNPMFVIGQRVESTIDPPARSKKVAVIGGGPAGMRAAIIAAERGHKVTLYEKNDFLGGQLRHADFASFQWPLKDYKDYLIRQMDKAGVEVHLNTTATPDMIKAKKYDAVLAALGSEPIVSDIPGAKAGNILAPIYVFGNRTLGKNIVVVGGDLVGTQTGMHLAENGHRVTVLTCERELGTDGQRVHYLETLQLAYEALENFSFIAQVTTTGISDGKVTYRDSAGNEKFIQADNVVVSAGRQPRKDEALKFYGLAERFFIIGDCDAAGFLPAATRTAWAAAVQV